MSVEGHIQSLESKKKMLEQKLHEVMSQPSADSTMISQLKREKLKIKDEIAQFAQD